MANRWMDDRDRDRDERDWRGQGHYSREQYTRGGRDEDRGEYRGRGRWDEERSFDRGDYDEDDYQGDVGYEGGRDKVFGQRETGASYGGETDRRYGRYGGGYRGGEYDRDRPGWQNPEYGGVSPAMRRGGGYGRGRFDDYELHDYPRRQSGPGRGEGGRYYGDDARDRIYREEWSQGRRDYGQAPRGYDAGYSETRARYHERGYGQPGFGGSGEPSRDQMREDAQRAFSGGTGGYDYERGYGDAGRSEGRSDRTRKFEEAGRGAGDFLHRAGQRMADWFSGGSEARAYDDRERDRGGRRGMGPQGYRRSDDRISEDAHERLTDDSWLDASSISVSVSGGEVTLAGTVESREAKHRAERIVEDISGVSHVQNNLRIQKAGPLRSDSTGYGDTVAEAQMRREGPTGTSGAGDGGGQSTASRKQ